jgi:hypothetical protein
VAVRVVSTAAVAAAAGPPVGSVVGAPIVATAAVRVTAAAVVGAVRARRRLSEYGWAELGAQLEYGWDRGWRCDL